MDRAVPQAAYTAHPLSVVEEGATVGARTRVWHFAHVRKGAVVGNDCIIGKDAYIDTEVVMGDGCKVQNGANLYRGLTLGDRVFVGPAAQFTNDLFPRAELWDDSRLVRTTVKDGASIGSNATIVCGITIGRYATVGAGAVVTKDVPDHGLVLGNPARLRGFVCVCGRPLKGGAVAGDAMRFTCGCGEATSIPNATYAGLEPR
ncbi:MAG TPA: acyltransferase [Candidatus Thermoplasmatota archaeon]|nr:acyltransferase [Candidatus Thermoplasmatota archaeon]